MAGFGSASDLLKASVQEFKDKKENALFWTIDRVYTTSGYSYLIKKKSKPISCAFHFAHSFEQDSILGKYETADIAINTNDELGFDGIITYKDLIVAFTGSGNYNEEMKMWHYFGVGAFNPINKQFLVLSEKEINDNLGVNSTEIILDLADKYPIVPHFFEAKSDKKYIIFEADENSPIDVGSCIDYDADGKLRLHKIDDVTLTFVNFTRNEAMQELYRIQKESLKPETKFGIMSEMLLRNEEVYQIAFNWRSLAYSCDFTINYYALESEKNKVPKIKKIVYNFLQKL